MTYRICGLLAVVLTTLSIVNGAYAESPGVLKVGVDESFRDGWNVGFPNPSIVAGESVLHSFELDDDDSVFYTYTSDREYLVRLGLRGSPLRVELRYDKRALRGDAYGSPEFSVLYSISIRFGAIRAWEAKTCSELASLEPSARRKVLARIALGKTNFLKQVVERNVKREGSLSDPAHFHYETLVRTLVIRALQDISPDCSENPIKLALEALAKSNAVDPYVNGPVPAYGGH